MSRRPGQNGRIEQRGNTYYARFWLDEPGKDQRSYKRVRICPVVGPGALNPSQRKRRLREIIAEHGAHDEATVRAADAANLGTTFREQSVTWLKEVQARDYDPIKARTAATWKGHLKYLNEKIGDIPVTDINNRSMKTQLIAVMKAERRADGGPRFSPKTRSRIILGSSRWSSLRF